MKIVLASSNEHKVKEINEIIKKFPLLIGEGKGEVLAHKKQYIEFILPPFGFDPEETGSTFEENSYIKAFEAWKLAKTWVLADDSGLCIDALDGKPGIYSARYAETPQKRIDRVLSEMEGVRQRTARFKCAMTLINPKGEVAFKYTGVCEGSIVESERGHNGFGYDPIFLLKDSDRTMAELSEDEKNQVSHRARALNAILGYIARIS